MVASFIFLVLGAWFFYRKRTAGLQRFDLLAAFAIKLAACAVFLHVYTHYYGDGSLTADPEEFMKESAVLARVAGNSVGDYLQFMFGLESDKMVMEQLAATSHWTAGDLTWINDSKNVIRANSLVYFLSAGNIWAHCIVFAFLSVLGFRELHLAFETYFDKWKRLFWFGVLCIPSVLFWTSGMLKEPLMIAGFCLVIRAFFSDLPFVGKAWRFVLGAFLMLAFKPYVFFCLVPVLAWHLAAVRLRKKVRVAILVLAPLLVIFGLNLAPGKRDQVAHYLTRKQFDFINVGRGGLHVYADTCFFYFRPDQFEHLVIYPDSSTYLKKPLVAKMMKTGATLPFKDVYLRPNSKKWIAFYNEAPSSSFIHVTEIQGSYSTLIKTIPEALAIACLRPFPTDPGGSLKYFAFCESVILAGLLLFFALTRWKYLPEKLSIRLTSLLIFCAFLSLLIGWTTPVLGAVVRYRIPVYLVFGTIILILAFGNKKKFSNE